MLKCGRFRDKNIDLRKFGLMNWKMSKHGSFENESGSKNVEMVVMEDGIRNAYWFNPIDL